MSTIQSNCLETSNFDRWRLPDSLLSALFKINWLIFWNKALSVLIVHCRSTASLYTHTHIYIVEYIYTHKCITHFSCGNVSFTNMTEYVIKFLSVKIVHIKFFVCFLQLCVSLHMYMYIKMCITVRITMHMDKLVYDIIQSFVFNYLNNSVQNYLCNFLHKSVYSNLFNCIQYTVKRYWNIGDIHTHTHTHTYIYIYIF
jgi:hypothetical protein